MSSAFQRDGRWYVKFKDASGRWRAQVTRARTKTEARRLADDLDRKAERPRLGLEPMPQDSSLTVTELCRWWIAKHCPEPSREIESRRFEKHICAQPIGELQLQLASTERFEEHLSGLPLGPASKNKLRSMLHSAFERARKKKLWVGVNPLADVEPQRVVKKRFDTLTAEEVPLLMPHIPEDWRGFFAVALWAGLRKGEACGLLKADVDLPNRIILVARSYDRDTTKGGHADALPIAEPLVPFLEAALINPSAWMFPGPGGQMRDSTCAPHKILRTALKAAGLIRSWEHRCRARGCEHREPAQDGGERRCPVHGRKLWPRAIPREMRFHDLRHTVVTLLLRAKVDPHRVQKIARHADIRTTLGTYGHLNVEDLRAGIATLPNYAPLALGAPVVQARDAVVEGLVLAADTLSNAEPLEDGRSRDRTYDSCRVKAETQIQILSDSDGLSSGNSLSVRSSESEHERFLGVPFGAPVVQGSEPRDPPRTAPVVQDPVLKIGLLTVRMAAEQLRVSTTAVYRMIHAGQLPHVVLNRNTIRIRAADLERLLRG